MKFSSMIIVFALGLTLGATGGCAAEGELDDVDSGAPDLGAVVDDAGREDAETVEDATSEPDAAQTICDVFAPACPDGQKCVPNPELGQSTCIPNGTQNAVGEPCERVTECVEGAACVDNGFDTLCRELCDKDDIESCTGARSFCTQTLGSDPSIGVCEAEPDACDIYAQDCASGDCVLRRNPADDTLGAYCGSAGSVVIGQPCGGGAGRCVAGAICIQAGADTEPTCHAVCRDPDRPCASGACTGTSGSGIDFCI